MTRSPSTSAMEEKATREELAALLAKMRSGNGPATVEEDAHTGTCALSLGSDPFGQLAEVLLVGGRGSG